MEESDGGKEKIRIKQEGEKLDVTRGEKEVKQGKKDL